MDGDLFEGEESTLPGEDEDWWTAVLLEEKRWNPFSDEIDSEPHKSHPIKIDWEIPLRLMKQDEIITLEVRGYNRGGLLVQGDQLQGFVPLSHLLHYDSNSSEDERRTLINNYVGSRIELKVIECDPGKDRIVFSERAAKAGCGKRTSFRIIVGQGASRIRDRPYWGDPSGHGLIGECG
jgi:small subunit ribosomal protein S1